MADIMAEAQAMVNSYTSSANDAASELKGLAMGAIDTFSFAPRSDITVGRATLENISAAPVMTSVVIPSDIAKYLKENPDKYKKHIWESTFFDDLESTITRFINSGGTGISQTVQDAIYNQGYARRRRMLQDDLRDIFAGAGQRGWLLPRDMEVAARNERIDKFDMDYNDVNLKTVQITAERAQQNVQWAMEHGIKIEDIHQSFAINYSGIYLKLTDSLIREFEAEVNQRVKEYEGKIKGRAQEIDVARISAELDDKGYTREMEKWRLDNAELTTRGNAYIAQMLNETKIRIEAAVDLMNYFRSAVSGVTGMINAIQTTAPEQERQ